MQFKLGSAFALVFVLAGCSPSGYQGSAFGTAGMIGGDDKDDGHLMVTANTVSAELPRELTYYVGPRLHGEEIHHARAMAHFIPGGCPSPAVLQNRSTWERFNRDFAVNCTGEGADVSCRVDNIPVEGRFFYGQEYALAIFLNPSIWLPTDAPYKILCTKIRVQANVRDILVRLTDFNPNLNVQIVGNDAL